MKNGLLHLPGFRNFFTIPLMIVLVGTSGWSASPLSSGKPILVGTNDQLGPLATHAVINTPLGFASVFGSDHPDLFVGTGRFGKDTGLFLFPFLETSKDETPVFGEGVHVTHPFEKKYPPAGNIYQSSDGTIHGLWIQKGELVHTIFDREKISFDVKNRILLNNLPRHPQNLTILPNPNGTVEVLLEISDGVSSRPQDFSGRDPRYQPYDGAGIWRGGLPYVFLYAVTLRSFFAGPPEEIRQISVTQREVLFSYDQLAIVNLGTGRERDLIVGSHYGGLHYYHNTVDQGVALEARVHIVRSDGNAHRHPIVKASPIAYPNNKTGFSDLVVGGEGALYFYQFTGKFTTTGKPIYNDPKPVLQKDADLYGGTLPVPNVSDWNGDGKMDFVSGNSEGRILFFQNIGSNEIPAFLPAVPLKAAGQEIHVQSGYRMDIQGPGEARWGYTCPTVADWNGDGLPDILMSDCTARHTIFLNQGDRTNPRLAAGHPLYMDGLDLHGTWRVKPAVAKLGTRMAYVALDDDDQFHLYWRIDDYNLEDGGKLKLEEGKVIGANFLHAGGTGRLKLNLVDWDQDDRIDLIVGTPRHGSVPNPENGLPQSLGLPGSAVLFLRNVNTNTEPLFAFPELLKFRGEPIFLGQHACAPAPADFGNPEGLDLIVGEEDGRFIFYKRGDLSHTQTIH